MMEEKDRQKTYSTKEVATIIGIHVNTVRFYEEMGFLTKPGRRTNGYRIYRDLHIDQCRLIRVAMRAEVLQNGLRKKAVEIVRLCAMQKYDAAIAASLEYSEMISGEINCAKAAIESVEGSLQNHTEQKKTALSRKEAADVLHVTPETLRTWERSGLISITRRDNGYRTYSNADMERLNIVRTLRCANYSLSAILRLMNGLDKSPEQSVEALLNNPAPDEDIVSVCDKLITSLQNIAIDAKLLTDMLIKIKSNYRPYSNTPILN